MFRKLMFMIVALAGILAMFALSGCISSSGGGIHIEWVEGRSATVRGISGGPYIGHVPTPHIAMGYSAICKDSSDTPIPALWSLDQPLIDIKGAYDEDPTATPLDTICCEARQIGDCQLTATAGAESCTVRVRCLGALELNWTSYPTTVYFRLRSIGAEQLSSPEGADIALNVIGPLAGALSMDYTITCLNGNTGKAYLDREGYTQQYDWEPIAADLTETNLPRSENYAFINGDGDVVSVTVSGIGTNSSVMLYFFH